MQISAMWNHQIDANLIYVAFCWCKGDINETTELLSKFEQWKFRDNNKQNYKKKIYEFLERRCCNHNINMFFMFLSRICVKLNAIKYAAATTANNGLPFVEKDKK
ncbi:hypothetical protein RFI_40275 [Reticulomyxa filosa]|uniref:Uncharacterized protein n=1 Tax=Reticulomyxa filosa TaxID=46433 RepID=X6L892_RETFI|nr:hypothetical protein RFI_40275 [Reticulomyxa filosa]|eukprot:ETN97256.1 hypothetical protein RFI_40275 [Reticulomyxa filosa]